MITLHPQVLSASSASSCHQPSEVLRLLENHPPRLPHYAYGTAGFRYDASVMDAVLIRVAVFCVWWYPQLQLDSTCSKDTIGIMVTASHNDESYNGVKLVVPNGEILADPVVQGQLTDWVNSDSDSNRQEGKHPVRVWLEALAEQSTNVTSDSIIHIGYDTRSHSPPLSELAIQAIRALGGQVINHGVATTPLLHHAVFHHNPHRVPSMIPLRPDAAGYYQLLASSYLALMQTATNSNHSKKRLVVDCACGVGYPSLELFQSTLQSLTSPASTAPFTQICPMNGPAHGPLNENCGSEHVQKTNAAPQWYKQGSDDYLSSSSSVEYCAALDGDADRIVFFHQGDDKNFFLLDGDKITVLLCEFLQSEVAALRKACQERGGGGGQLSLGAVQTAYANGASTKYLKVSNIYHVLA
jgi:phosphoacetylglucosamine mutase